MINIILNNFKRYRKGLIIWIIAWGAMSVLMFSMFEGIADSFTIDEKFFEMYPEAMREAFAIDSDTFGTPEGFFSAELLTMYITGVIIFITSHLVTLLADETVVVTLLRPIGKMKILIANMLYIMLEIVLINAAFIIFGIISQLVFIEDPVNLNFYIAAMMGANFVAITGAGIVLLLSSLFKRSVSLGFGIMYPLLSLIVDGVAALDGVPDSLKYFSIYHYLNIKMISREFTVDYERLPVLLVVLIVTSILGAIFFNRKDVDL